MKAWLIIPTVAFSSILVVGSLAESIALPPSLVEQEIKPNLLTDLLFGTDSLSRLETVSETETNICRIFSKNQTSEDEFVEAPPPVRTVYDGDSQKLVTLDRSEILFYQQLGLTQSRDGSHICLAEDPQNSRRQFTIFKVKKINNILVISTFLNSGKFMAAQETAATNLFVEMISFYTDIPDTYRQNIRDYLQEFYLRLRDGRIMPSKDRAYPIDEPTASVIIYHSLTGVMPGTGISLNIPLQ